MKIAHDASTPQILIYHTHSLEGYADSIPGDKSTTVVGVGDYLTELLTQQYGYNVIHDTGEYDTIRDKAYSKALLRDACKDLLPEELLHRKKSPYPKTYHPGYEKLLIAEMQHILDQPDAPVKTFIDTKKLETFLEAPTEYGKPWFGQLRPIPCRRQKTPWFRSQTS